MWGTDHLLVDGHGPMAACRCPMPGRRCSAPTGGLSSEPHHELAGLALPAAVRRVRAVRDTVAPQLAPGVHSRAPHVRGLRHRPGPPPCRGQRAQPAAEQRVARCAVRARLEAARSHSVVRRPPDAPWTPPSTTGPGNVLTNVSHEATVESPSRRRGADRGRGGGGGWRARRFARKALRSERYEELDWMEAHKPRVPGREGGGKWTEARRRWEPRAGHAVQGETPFRVPAAVGEHDRGPEGRNPAGRLAQAVEAGAARVREPAGPAREAVSNFRCIPLPAFVQK